MRCRLTEETLAITREEVRLILSDDSHDFFERERLEKVGSGPVRENRTVDIGEDSGRVIEQLTNTDVVLVGKFALIELRPFLEASSR